MILNLITTIFLIPNFAFAQDAVNPDWSGKASSGANGNAQSFVYETDELGRTVKKSMIQIAQVVQQENSKYNRCKKRTKCGACCRLFYDKTTMGIQQGYAYVNTVVELENTYCQSSATECNHKTSEGLTAHFDQAKARLKNSGKALSSSVIDVSTLKVSGAASAKQIEKALSGAGVSSGDIQVTQQIDAEKYKSEVDGIAQKINKIFEDGFMSETSGGKGNLSTSKEPSEGKGHDLNFSNKKISAEKRKKLDLNAAAYSKDYFGDPIGIAQDDLFKMIARRYKSKEGQEFFFSK